MPYYLTDESYRDFKRLVGDADGPGTTGPVTGGGVGQIAHVQVTGSLNTTYNAYPGVVQGYDGTAWQTISTNPVWLRVEAGYCLTVGVRYLAKRYAPLSDGTCVFYTNPVPITCPVSSSSSSSSSSSPSSSPSSSLSSSPSSSSPTSSSAGPGYWVIANMQCTGGFWVWTWRNTGTGATTTTNPYGPNQSVCCGCPSSSSSGSSSSSAPSSSSSSSHSSSSAPSSSANQSSSSSSSGGDICCPGVTVPNTLYVTFGGAWASVGTVTVTRPGPGSNWTGLGSGCGVTNGQLTVSCLGNGQYNVGAWTLYSGSAAPTSCSPFSLSTSGTVLVGSCTGLVTATVTE